MARVLGVFLVLGSSEAWTAGSAFRSIHSLVPRRLVPHARCQEAESLPDSVSEAIPPERLADAWRREEKAKELAEVLRGCSLYLVGLGPRKTAVGRVLARRLPRYRFYDLGELMCSTYKAMTGSTDAMGTKQLLAAESLADVEELSSSILGEVQQFSRSIHVVWDGAVSTSSYMVMQQGIVVHLDTEASPDELALPTVDSDAVLERWREGHLKADVCVKLSDGVPVDDAVVEVVDTVLQFIEQNPAKSQEWKAAADEALSKQDE